MLCYKIDSCAFLNHYKNRFGEKTLRGLMNSYCKGPLQPLCRRLAYMAACGEDPPIDLCPDGYKAGTGTKVEFKTRLGCNTGRVNRTFGEGIL